MKTFSDLLENLLFSPAKNRKIQLIIDYLKTTPDPDRGYAIAAICGDLKINSVQPSLLRKIVEERYDSDLFRLSYDYVGDLAETIALIWDDVAQDKPAYNDVRLAAIVTQLQQTSKRELPNFLISLFSNMAARERYALIKLTTGGFRIGVSSRLIKQALAQYGNVPINDLEELWHGLEPPYQALFAWLEGLGDKPVTHALAPFRPVMLSHPLEERDHGTITPEDYIAEWKWDGIRVQLSHEGGIKKLYSRTGDDISPAFPDMIEALEIEGTFDGELLVRSPLSMPLEIRPFGDLQQRLNRKNVSKNRLKSHPAFLRIYDLLIHQGKDIRGETLDNRKIALAEVAPHLPVSRFDISPLLPFNTWDDLRHMRENLPDKNIEGLMLKKRISTYVAGRPRGPWFKWKRDPMTIDAVLLYAQHGHGKRSGLYSDFTFGCWHENAGTMELVPVGKAYFGFTDEELKMLDKFVRAHTIERFGPVRSVKANQQEGLVLEVAFEGINKSPRHKSGIAMRFPRISRIRWDKPPHEADNLKSLENLIAT